MRISDTSSHVVSMYITATHSVYYTRMSHTYLSALPLTDKSLSVLVPVRLRLQNINALAKYELPNYTGPLLPVDYLELHKVRSTRFYSSDFYLDRVSQKNVFLLHKRYYLHRAVKFGLRLNNTLKFYLHNYK